MNKKTILKIIALLVIGAVFGFLISFGLLKLDGSKFIDIGNQISMFIFNNTVEIFLGLFVLLYFPAVYFYQKGKRIYNRMDDSTDDEMDQLEKMGSKNFDLSLSISNVFLILTFVLFGIAFKNTISEMHIVIIVFLFNCIANAVLQIITIKYIQKIDSRLKGDPTSLKFAKNFVESCDEAEKLKIYKSGYHSFQFSKNTAFALLMLSILCNFTLDTGMFPILLTGVFTLVQVVSYSYFAMKNEV